MSKMSGFHKINQGQKKLNLVFRATVLKTLGRVGSIILFFLLRIETSIIKTPTKKNGIFVK